MLLGISIFRGCSCCTNLLLNVMGNNNQQATDNIGTEIDPGIFTIKNI